jgi:hypothetical protein
MTTEREWFMSVDLAELEQRVRAFELCALTQLQIEEMVRRFKDAIGQCGAVASDVSKPTDQRKRARAAIGWLRSKRTFLLAEKGRRRLEMMQKAPDEWARFIEIGAEE